MRRLQPSLRNLGLLGAALLAFAVTAGAEESAPVVRLGGAGWTQFGRIENSYVGTDLSNNYNNNWMQSTGGQLSVNATFDPEWEGALSLGVVGTHLARGAVSEIDHWQPFWVAYVGEARVSYAHRFGEASAF